MKEVAIMSDTHSCIDDRIIKSIEGVNEIWHAGDIGCIDVCDKLMKISPLHAVYGNIDDYIIRSEYKEWTLFETERLRVLMTHIGGYPKHYNKRALDLINKYRPDVFVCGHSHILRVMYDNDLNVMTINPGAAGMYGIQTVRTIIRLKIDDGKMINLDVLHI